MFETSFYFPWEAFLILFMQSNLPGVAVENVVENSII